MKKLLSTFAIFLALYASSFAQSGNVGTPSMGSPAVPDIVTNGFDAYQKSGSSAAVDVWLKGSPMNDDLTSNLNYHSSFTKVEGIYGKYLNWELVKLVAPSPSTRLVYLVIKFEKGPMWVVFYCYKATDQWTIPTLDLSTNPAKILPPNLLSGS